MIDHQFIIDHLCKLVEQCYNDHQGANSVKYVNAFINWLQKYWDDPAVDALIACLDAQIVQGNEGHNLAIWLVCHLDGMVKILNGQDPQE